MLCTVSGKDKALLGYKVTESEEMFPYTSVPLTECKYNQSVGFKRLRVKCMGNRSYCTSLPGDVGFAFLKINYLFLVVLKWGFSF